MEKRFPFNDDDCCCCSSAPSSRPSARPRRRRRRRRRASALAELPASALDCEHLGAGDRARVSSSSFSDRVELQRVFHHGFFSHSLFLSRARSRHFGAHIHYRAATMARQELKHHKYKTKGENWTIRASTLFCADRSDERGGTSENKIYSPFIIDYTTTTILNLSVSVLSF